MKDSETKYFHGSRFDINDTHLNGGKPGAGRPSGVYYSPDQMFATMYAFSNDRSSAPITTVTNNVTGNSMGIMLVRDERAFTEEREKFDQKGYIYTVQPEEVSAPEQGDPVEDGSLTLQYPVHIGDSKEKILTKEIITFDGAKEGGLQVFYLGNNAPKPRFKDHMRKSREHGRPRIATSSDRIEAKINGDLDQSAAVILELDSMIKSGALRREGNDDMWQEMVNQVKLDQTQEAALAASADEEQKTDQPEVEAQKSDQLKPTAQDLSKSKLGTLTPDHTPGIDSSQSTAIEK